MMECRRCLVIGLAAVLLPAGGINSFQPMFDGERWWIVNVFWEAESPTIRYPRGVCREWFFANVSSQPGR